jgi:hypothetical protein
MRAASCLQLLQFTVKGSLVVENVLVETIIPPTLILLQAKVKRLGVAMGFPNGFRYDVAAKKKVCRFSGCFFVIQHFVLLVSQDGQNCDDFVTLERTLG